MKIKLIFESILYVVEKDQSTLPDDERSISRNVKKSKDSWIIWATKKGRLGLPNIVCYTSKSYLLETFKYHQNVIHRTIRIFCLNIS